MRRNSKQRDARTERHHYTTTAHESVRAVSNSGQRVPGGPISGGTNTALRRDMPGTPDKRAAYPRMNTMTNRKHGGPSTYYRAKEGFGYGYGR